MKNKITISLLCTLFVAHAGVASPLTDYSEGKIAVEVGIQSPTISENYHDSVIAIPDANRRSTTSFGITTGLGNKLAIQYKSFSPKSKDTNYANITTFNTKLDSKEYNVLYKLNKNVSIFTGMTQVKGTQEINGNADTDGGSASTQRKNIWQIGCMSMVPVAEKTTAFASTAIGSNLIAYKLGIGYEMSKNLDFDVYYNYNQYKNLHWEFDNGQSDFTIKGVGYGITYKF